MYDRVLAPPTIAAVLDPLERPTAEAVGDGCFALVHRDSVREALRMVRERTVDAVLVSVRRGADESSTLEQFARRFPSIPTVALVTRHDPADAEALLRVGATGVRQVVDASHPNGWRRLRELLGGASADRGAALLRPICEAIGPMPAGALRFWEELVHAAPETATVRRLARRMQITPSTLVSRFARHELPSPKDHLVAVRLCLAARHFDSGELTVADVAYRLDYASPQSFGRHVRTVLGITPSEFRARFPYPMVLARFLDRLVVPHAATWREFNPLAAGRR